MSIAETKVSLRKQLRTARRALSADQQAQASIRFIDVFRPLLKTRKVRSIAAYTAMDGELDLAPLLDYCQQHRIQVFLPILHQYKPTLWFAQYQDGDHLYPNRFGIPEPLDGKAIRPWQLDVVLLPLVGFDEQGHRLGMGGGFYDRTFANRAQWPKQPKLWGVAHECQKVVSIPLERWDIPLDGIMTDKQSYRPQNAGQ